MNQRLTIKLNNPTIKSWELFKSMHTHLDMHAKNCNIELSDLVWDDINHIKSVSLKSFTDKELIDFLQQAAVCLKERNLTAEYLNCEDISGVRSIINDLKIITSLNHKFN